ncbi:phage tail protein [Providencia alcalifaciens]|uniref:phage tail protein n=1 Tax=Providencia alcalifaciens TaxID=126385 RepID=UPI003908B47D
MQTFDWKVASPMVVNSAPRVRRVQFGEGYEQRVADGVNCDLKKYEVTVKVSRDEGKRLETFFAKHGGWRAFF